MLVRLLGEKKYVFFCQLLCRQSLQDEVYFMGGAATEGMVAILATILDFIKN